jgi:hypothetical protein
MKLTIIFYMFVRSLLNFLSSSGNQIGAVRTNWEPCEGGIEGRADGEAAGVIPGGLGKNSLGMQRTRVQRGG